MGVADVAMAGHASAQDLAGVSLGVSVWHIVMISLMGVLMAVNPIVSQHVGAGQFGLVPRVVRQALWKALGVSLIAMLAANAAALVFARLNVEPAVRVLARDFVFVIGFGLPAFCCYRVLYGYSASVNQTKPMMVISLLALLVNIAVNWLLVFGHLGFPRLGGAGVRLVHAVLCVVQPDRHGVVDAPRARVSSHAAVRAVRDAALARDPNLAPNRFADRRDLFRREQRLQLIALLVADFGTVQVGAHQIALNFASLVFMAPMSLGIALLTRVGQALGAGDAASARFRAWVGVGMALAVATISALLIALLNRRIAAAYNNDLAVAALASQLLIYAAVFQLSDATQVSTSSAIRAYKVTRSPMVIHLSAFWGLSLPLGCVLGLAPAWLPWRPVPAMAAQGFWIALVVGLTIAALALTWLLHRLSLRHVREQGLLAAR